MSAVVNRILRAFSLVVTDRRWTAPLSAAALGFGLFVGVAIGPSAAGTLAGTAQVIEIPTLGTEKGDAEVEAGGSSAGLGESLSGGGGGGALEALPAPAPLEPEPVAPPPAGGKPTPEPAPPRSKPPVEEDEEETELRGVVVHANPAAGSYALAIKGGELVPIHARELPSPGAKLTVTARRLANGTFAEAEPPERTGKVTQASFRGVVTFIAPDPAAPAYTVSGRGASVLVHVEPDPSGVPPQLPALGSYVTVTAGIAKPEPLPTEPAPAELLWQNQIEIETGPTSTYLDLAGIVSAVLPETAQILLSADDSGIGGKDLTLSVPTTIDLAAVRASDSYLATATVEPDGSLTLAGLASDEQIKGADDAASAQGDLRR